MAETNNSQILSVVYPVCCGLDVHKKHVSACLLHTDESGEIISEIREFQTFTDDLMNLRDWLVTHDCPIAAIESTGVYWRPVHNVLEGHLEVILVNARHVKNVPGRKTDIHDAKWLSGLLRYGLLRGSFILPREVRQWRELWAIRQSYVRTVGDFRRRIHKNLQCANIKIDSVVSDLFGVTGRNLMKLLIARQSDITLEEIDNCTRGTLRSKSEELYRSIKGFFTNHHAYILSTLLQTVESLEAQIETITRTLRSMMTNHDSNITKLDKIPGINEIGAMGILSQLGVDLSAFPTVEAFCSWQGLCPGNNESAGKRHSGKPVVRKHPLKTLFIELAWTAIKKKGSYYKEKFHRLKARRGAKRAITAIAHKLAKAVYHVLKKGEDYRELGEAYLDQRNKSAKLNRLRAQARTLGFVLVSING
jgi:transposase